MARLALQQAAHGLSGLHIASGDLSIEEIPEINWLEKCYREFPPFSVGPFFIHGSHHDGPAPEGQITLRIDAATAFGQAKNARSATQVSRHCEGGDGPCAAPQPGPGIRSGPLGGARAQRGSDGLTKWS